MEPHVPDALHFLDMAAETARAVLTFRDNNEAVLAALFLNGRSVGASGCQARASWYREVRA